MTFRRKLTALTLAAMACFVTVTGLPAHAAEPALPVGLDKTTKGNRCTYNAKYGSFAYALPNGADNQRPTGGNDPAQPALPSLGETGGPGFDGAGQKVTFAVHGPTETEDKRGLETPDQTKRRATTNYGSNFKIEMQLPVGDYDIAAYIVDFDANGRMQTTAAASGDTETVTTNNFVQGSYEVFRVHSDGLVKLSFSSTTPNAVVSGIFVDSAPAPVTGTNYVKNDKATRGDWVGKYGSKGYALIGFNGPTTGDPSWAASQDLAAGLLAGKYTSTGRHHSWTDFYAQGTVTRTAYSYGWSDWLPNVGGDERAQHFYKYQPLLGGVNAPGDRRAATWDSGNELSVNADNPNRPLILDLKTPSTHAAYDLSLYFLEWDRANRKQSVTLADLGGSFTDGPRTIENFGDGIYLRYRVPGNANLRATMQKLAGINSVLGGVFLDPATSGPYGYKSTDTTTKGNASTFTCAYGNDGYVLANAVGNLETPIGGSEGSEPATASRDEVGGPVFSGTNPQGRYAVHGPATTPDDRALYHPDAGRRRPTAAFGSQVVTRLRLPAGTWRVSLYGVDWDRNGRMQSTLATNGSTWATHTANSISGGVYERYLVKSDGSTPLTITVQLTSGPNAVFSGVFVDQAPSSVTGISYESTDTTTQGNWIGAYGTKGYALLGMDTPTVGNPEAWAPDKDINAGVLDETNQTAPASRPYEVITGSLYAWTNYYAAEETLQNAYAWRWSDWMPGATGDVRAQRFYKFYAANGGPAQPGDRRAATWDSADEMRGKRPLIVDLGLPSAPAGKNAYRIAVYMVDYDRQNRSQEIKLYDAVTDTLLDTKVVGASDGLQDGLYLSWNVAPSSSLRIEARALNGTTNAVIGGLFVDGVNATLTAASGKAYTTPAPVDFSPKSGPGGTLITIYGCGFNDVKSAQINGSPLKIESITQTIIKVRTYNYTPSGPITIYHGPSWTQVPTAKVFRAANAPVVNSFSPTAGAGGTLITITGSRFANAKSVQINGSPLKIESATDTIIKARTYNYTPSGPITVYGADWSPTASTGVFSAAVGPTITSVAPGARVENAQADFVVSGANFQPGATVVISQTPGPVTVDTVTFVHAGELRVRATIGAANATSPTARDLTVKNPDGTSAKKTAAFMVTLPPRNLTVTPAAAAPGSTVTVKITCTNCDPHPQLDFGHAGLSVVRGSVDKEYVVTISGCVAAGNYTPRIFNADGGTVNAAQPFVVSGAQNITNYSASNNASTVSFKADFAVAHSHYHVFIDRDATAGTGYATNGIGAEYMIENGTLYKWTGPGWKWSSLGTANQVVNGKTYSWQINRSSIGSGATFRAVFHGGGQNPDDATPPFSYTLV